jgi:hypothetical protein
VGTVPKVLVNMNWEDTLSYLEGTESCSWVALDAHQSSQQVGFVSFKVTVFIKASLSAEQMIGFLITYTLFLQFWACILQLELVLVLK